MYMEDRDPEVDRGFNIDGGNSSFVELISIVMPVPRTTFHRFLSHANPEVDLDRNCCTKWPPPINPSPTGTPKMIGQPVGPASMPVGTLSRQSCVTSSRQPHPSAQRRRWGKPCSGRAPKIFASAKFILSLQAS